MTGLPWSRHPHTLPWYVAGRLDPVASRKVEEHLKGCPACDRAARALASMSRSVRRLGEPHAGVEELVEFEAGGPADDPTVRARIEAHLARCESCRDDLAALENVRLALEKQTSPAPDAGPAGGQRLRSIVSKRLPLAGAAIALAMTGVAVWTLLAPARAARHVMFPSPQRGAGAAITLGEPGPWSITFGLPFTTPSRRYRVFVEHEDGSPLLAVGGAQLASADNSVDVLIDLRLDPGRYRFVLRSAENPAGESYTYPFEVTPRPSSGGGTAPP